MPPVAYRFDPTTRTITGNGIPLVRLERVAHRGKFAMKPNNVDRLGSLLTEMLNAVAREKGPAV